MSNDQDDDETAGDDTEAFVPDYFSGAIALAQIANNKTLEAAIKKLRKLDRQYADTQAKMAALVAQAEQINAALDARAAACAERERACDERDAVFERQATEVRDELHGHHARLEQTNRQLVHRILSCSGILAEWNPDLQPLPTWAQLRQRIADLPADLPAAPPAEVTQENVTADWTGHTFIAGSTLSRSINKAAS